MSSASGVARWVRSFGPTLKENTMDVLLSAQQKKHALQKQKWQSGSDFVNSWSEFNTHNQGKKSNSILQWVKKAKRRSFWLFFWNQQSRLQGKLATGCVPTLKEAILPTEHSSIPLAVLRVQEASCLISMVGRSFDLEEVYLYCWFLFMKYVWFLESCVQVGHWLPDTQPDPCPYNKTPINVSASSSMYTLWSSVHHERYVLHLSKTVQYSLTEYLAGGPNSIETDRW